MRTILILPEGSASIAFAQLAEEYRRAGQLPDAVAACKAGLADKKAILAGT